MSEKRSATKLGGWLARLAAALIAGVVGMLAQAPAQAGGNGFHIQVFALNGPVCELPISPEGECWYAPLSGAELVLQRWNRRLGAWKDIAPFTTNEGGYANLFVNSRGRYRVDQPDQCLANGICWRPMPWIEGPVQFRVPAWHKAADGFRVTPAVVKFDSGVL